MVWYIFFRQVYKEGFSKEMAFCGCDPDPDSNTDGSIAEYGRLQKMAGTLSPVCESFRKGVGWT
jgi:hypothetical protein